MDYARVHTTEEHNAMSDAQRKVLENRLRCAAQRQGLRLQKARARDPRHLLYGTYQLVNASTNFPVLADWAMQRGYGIELQDVEQYLFGDRAASA